MEPRLLANRAHARLLIATHGKLGGGIGGHPVLVLEPRGRRSGRPRRTPIQYLRHDADLVIVASNGGRHQPSAWSLNLLTEPAGRVYLNGGWIEISSRAAQGDERDRLWALLSQWNPRLLGAAQRAGRQLPVIVLSPLHECSPERH